MTELKEKPKNKYHGNAEYTDMSRTDWEDCWQDEKIYFHRSEYHPLLMRNLDILIAGREGIKIFVPLCGKSLDMKLFYNKGHTVVGVEGAQLAISQFFNDHTLQFERIECSEMNCSLFKTLDGKLQIYHSDIFDFLGKASGKFPAIWDRGSFGAINKGDRHRYVELISSFMDDSSQYLLDTYDYNPEQYSGPPHCFTNQDLHQYFGAKYNIKELEYMDVNSDRKRKEGITRFYEQLHQLTLK